MADAIVFKLDVDTSGIQTGQAAAALESLKRKIIETEQAIAKLKAETKGNAQAQLDAAGPFGQLQARLSALRTTFNDTARAATGMEGFTSKIGKQFKEALSPIQDMLGRLGPLGGAIQGIAGQLSNIGQKAGQSAEGINKLNGFTAGLGKAAGGALLGIGALIGGIAALGVGINSSIAAYDNSIKAQRSLEVALGHTSQALLDQASTLQDITGVQDDAITRGQAFAASLGLTEEQILKLTPAVLDLAAATGTDVNTAFEKVAQSIEGSKNSLGKYGIEISKTGSQSEKVTQVIAGLTEKFEGQAEAVGNAGAGAITKFQNNIDDLEETLGRLIIQGISPLVEGLTSAVHVLDDFITGNDELEANIEASTNSLKKQQTEFATLIVSLEDTNLKEDERNKIIEELNSKYPQYIGNINLEKATTAQLNEVLAKGNTLFIAKLALVANEEKLKELAKEQAAAAFDQAKAQGVLVAAIREKILAQNDAGDAAELKLLAEGKELDRLSNKYGILTRETSRAQVGIQNLKSAGVSMKTNDVDRAAVAFDNARRATEEAKKETEAFADEIIIAANNLGVESDVVTEVTGKLSIQGQASNDAFAALEKGTATVEQLEIISGKVADGLNKGTLAADDLTKSLETVGKALVIAQKDSTSNKGIIDQLTAEKKRIEDEIAALNTKVEDKTTKHNKAVVETYADRVKKISRSLDLELDAIDRAEDKKLITQVEADKRRNEALSKSLQERIKLEEDEAEKAAKKSKTGEIPVEFKVKIAGLEEEKRKVDEEVAKFQKEIERRVKEIQGKVTLRVEADLSRVDKEAADAISFSELNRNLSKAFEGSGVALTEELKKALSTAAFSGNKVDFDKLIANADLPKHKIEEVAQVYERYRLSVERNRIELVKSDDEAKLKALRDRLEELTRKREELTAKKESAAVDVSIVFTDADQADLEATEKELDTLDGQVVEAAVTVSVDSDELDKVTKKIDALEDGKKTRKKKDPGESALAKALGLDQDTTEFLVSRAQDLAQSIADIFLASQQASIDRRLNVTIDGLDQERDITMNDLEERLEAGLITQEEFNAKSSELDRQTETKKKEAQEKAFEESKRVKRAQATVNFGLELAGLAAAAPEAGIAAPLWYAINAGIAAVRYAANLQLINSAVAEEGAIVKAERGRIAQGPSHADGGIAGAVNGQQVIELEGDEAIINRRSTKAFAPLLSAINAHEGNGVPFAPEPISLEMLEKVAPEGTKLFAQRGHIVHGTALVNLREPDDDDEVTRHPKRAAFGAMLSFEIPSKKQKNPGLTAGDIGQQFAPFSRMLGGYTPVRIPKVFAGGGVSLIPSEDVIANKAQLRAKSTRVVQLNTEKQERQSVVFLSELSQKQSRIDRTINKITYGT